MGQLSVQLFDSFQVLLDGQPVTSFESDKVRALLIYLVVEAQRAQPREKLAGLLWPDFSDRAARTNLRRALANLRKAIQDGQTKPPFLNITNSAIKFNNQSDYTLDVTPFLGQPTEADISVLEARASAYQGSLLTGFSLADSEPFEGWLILKREQFRRVILASLQTLIEHYETDQDYSVAITYAYRLVDLEPWLEEGYQALMRLLTLSGQRSQALAQFEACRQALSDGLGVEVSQATQHLYEQIKTGELSSSTDGSIETVQDKASFPAYHLPAPTTSLVGRKRELGELTELLGESNTRLITILGPGGIGKSHLALELGRQLLGQFTHGVFFVPLATIEQTEQVIPTIAEVLGYPLQSDHRTPETQLQDFFREKSSLLILDNMEQLLTEVDLLGRFLQAAPSLKILVTSRERLKLHSETIFPLAGLNWPEDNAIAKPADEAIQLFYKTAQRIQPDVLANEANTQLIGSICRIVEGMPLAILLAAGWIDQLTLPEIAAELTNETGVQLDFLETDWPDVPERHQRIHTVFDQSWRRLSADERRVFMALSVFRGGFTRQAAQAVTEASLRNLTNLVNKSLLNRTADGRYTIHELLRQFGALGLETSPDYPDVRDTHTAHYASYLAQKGADLKGSRQIEALDEIERELGNIQHAWLWAIDQQQMTPMAQMIVALGMFYEWKGRYAEGETAFRLAAEALAGDQSSEMLRNYVRVLTWQAVFAAILGQHETAQQLFKRSSILMDQSLSELDLRAEQAFHLWQQGRYSQRQSFERARTLLEESLNLFQAIGDQWGQAYILAELSGVTEFLEPHKTSLQFQLLKDSLALHQSVGNKFGALEVLNKLGLRTAMRGDVKQCEDWYRQENIIYEQVKSELNLRRWLSAKGVAYWAMGRFEEALAIHQKQLMIEENFGALESIIGTKASLSMSHVFLGHYDQGIQLLEIAMQDYQQKGGQDLGYLLLQLGSGYIAQGHYQQAYNTLKQSVELHRATKANVRLYTVLNNFGLAAWHADKVAEAISAQDEVLIQLTQGDFYFIQIGLLPLVALLQLSQDNPVLAIEFYALALKHPHISNSQWYADIVGRYIDEAAQNLPVEVVTAAQKRGRERELNPSIQELAAQMIVNHGRTSVEANTNPKRG